MVVTSRFSRRPHDVLPLADKNEVAFLFCGNALRDCSPAARRIFDLTEPAAHDLDRIIAFLAPRFQTLADEFVGQGPTRANAMTSDDGRSLLRIKPVGETLRITLEAADGKTASGTPDGYCFDALQDELQLYRGLVSSVDFPMWVQNSDGGVIWSNAEYKRLEDLLDPDGPLFADKFVIGGDAKRIQRTKLDLPGETESRWYEFQISPSGAHALVKAVPVDRVVQAERSLGGFVQTLTQTFAHLNVGLAVFNRARELAIFNPALSELLELSPEFLVTRPSLHQMFDRLREQRMVPEQKDYKAWRRKMSELEAAASDTAYSETWSLIDGRTLRVTGRPHPEGAVAFLFEDISNEILLERRFRSELQIGLAVIDGLDEAIAVFSPSGALVMANRSYMVLWHGGVEEDLTGSSFVDATRRWSGICQPTPVWGDARDFAATMGERSNWTADVTMESGRVLQCRFDALMGGHTLVGFSETYEKPLEVATRMRA